MLVKGDGTKRSRLDGIIDALERDVHLLENRKGVIDQKDMDHLDFLADSFFNECKGIGDPSELSRIKTKVKRLTKQENHHD